MTPDSPAPPKASTPLPALDELMLLFPRVINGMGRHIEQVNTAASQATIGPRHCAALRYLMHEPLSVGALASVLEITLPTASGVLAVLDGQGLIVRTSDPADRRRTIVAVAPERRTEVTAWLADLGDPLAQTLTDLSADETAAFLRAMRLFAAAVSPDELGPPADCVARDLG